MTLISENGLQDCSKLSHALVERLGINKINTSSYYPCSNGGIEGVNHTMAQMLSLGGNEQRDNWDKLLPHVESTYNNSVNASTGLLISVFHTYGLWLPHRRCRGGSPSIWPILSTANVAT